MAGIALMSGEEAWLISDSKRAGESFGGRKLIWGPFG